MLELLQNQCGTLKAEKNPVCDYKLKQYLVVFNIITNIVIIIIIILVVITI